MWGYSGGHGGSTHPCSYHAAHGCAMGDAKKSPLGDGDLLRSDSIADRMVTVGVETVPTNGPGG